MKRMTMAVLVLALLLGLGGMASAQLPAGWSQADIGNPSPAGSASYDQATGTWTVTGDGQDIWDTYDSFHFVFRRLKGDGMMTARVVSIAGAGPNEWAKAGVMIRETLNANSRHAMTAMTPGITQNHAAQFLWRPTTDGFSGESSGGSMNLPYWVRIVRTGNTFRGYISPNGSTWTPQGTAETISMSQDVYIGLAAVSHVAGQLGTDRFDNVAIQGELIEPVPAKAITYQGRLLDGDLAADGLYDLQFSLYDAQTGGSQKGQPVAIEDMDVVEGYFTVDLDFGEGAFDGNPRWLQIAVRPGASTGSLTVLDPRQRIAPTPYALYAFSSPRTHYYSVSGDDFLPCTNVGTTTYYRGTGPGGSFIMSGWGDMIASVHLPHGAALTEMKAYFCDEDGTEDLELHLARLHFEGGYNLLASADSSGISGYGNKSVSFSHNVNNRDSAYELFVSNANWATARENLRIMGVVITYTLSEAP